jgi:hypothetical protein
MLVAILTGRDAQQGYEHPAHSCIDCVCKPPGVGVDDRLN